MSVVTLGDLPVIDLRLSLPLKGRWHASVVAFAPEQPPPSRLLDLVIKSEDVEQLRATGTPAKSENPLDTIVVELVAGADGLKKQATPRSYRSTTAQTVLNDLVSDSGEKLSSTIDVGLLQTSIERWSTIGRNVGACIEILSQQLGVGWRFLLDGSLWLGKEAWPSVSPSADVSQYDPLRTAVELASEDVLVLPGQTFQQRQVNYAQVDMLNGALRERLFFSSSTPGASLRAFVEHTMAPVDFHALYKATVTSQNADGSCEVTVDDERFPGYSKVPIKFGTPGTTAKVNGGARVLLGFDDGWPDAPYVALWEASTATELNFGGGTDFAALASLVNNNLSSMANYLSTHVHSGGTISGSTGPPTAPQPPPSDVSASVVKVK